MNRAIIAPIRAEHGQDLLEYALLTALIVLAAAVAVGAAGNAISGTLWGYVVNGVAAAL